MDIDIDDADLSTFEENRNILIQKQSTNQLNTLISAAYAGYFYGLAECKEISLEEYFELISLLPLTKEEFKTIIF